MTKKKTELAVIENKDVSKSVNILLALKTELSAQAQNCMQIKVTDDSTLSVCQQNLSKLNKLVKTVKDKGKELSDPYYNAYKQIQAATKDLILEAETAVDHMKNEVKEWEIKKREESDRIKAELEAKAQESAAELLAEETRRYNIRSAIDKAQRTLRLYLDKCHSIEECDFAIHSIEKDYKPKDFFEEYAEEAYTLKDNYLNLIKAKKNQLENFDKLSESEKNLLAEKENLAKLKMEMEEKMARIKASEDAIALEKAKREEEERLAAERARIEAEEEMNATRNIRGNWRFELVDKTKLTPEWTTIDEAAVKAYLKDNKANIKDGEIINGVKFYKEITVVA